MPVSIVTAEHYRDYVERLVRLLGREPFGQGAYASVFQHPTYPNIVVKVYRKDRGYEAYLAWCAKNKRNKYVPKFIGKARVFWDSDHNYIGVVFMEKLTSLTQRDLQTFGRKIQKTMKDLGDVVSGDLHFDRDEWSLLAVHHPDPDLRAFSAFMRENWEQEDIKRDNLMKRGDQLVFIDPLG